MKIFIGVTEISGLATGLKKGLLSAGVDAQAVFRMTHSYGYEGNSDAAWVVRVWQFLGNFYSKRAKQKPLVYSFKVLHYIWGFVVLAWALCNYDTFLFLFGMPITNTALELRLLRLMRKKIIFFYVGSDSRPPYIDGSIALSEPAPSVQDYARLVGRMKRMVQRNEHYADINIASSYSAHFHSRKFVNCFALGIPKNISATDGSSARVDETGPVRILHAPSQSKAKGSELVAQIIERLQKKGCAIDFVNLKNVTNAVVLAEISRCDFVVDQAYSDTPMAALATEAANLGKPSVVGGYAAIDVQSYLSVDDIPPTLYVHPDQLEAAIERMICDAEFRRALGARARDFVSTRWSSEEIIRRYIQLFRGDIPEDWWQEPQNVRYLHGYGMPEAYLKSLIGSLVDAGGIQALGISDKPELERRFLELIEPTDKVA